MPERRPQTPPEPGLGDFTQQAEVYARSRPGYPSALLERLIGRAEIVAGDPVADFGAGTGIFTGLLATHGLAVTAVEPNAAMCRLAPEEPPTRWVRSTFESSGLATESQAWVVAAQAFHWAQPAKALPELRRILRPGGKLTVLWNNRQNDREPIVAATWETILRLVPDFEPAYRDRDWDKVLTSTGDFYGDAFDEEEHTVRMERRRFAELWRSHNRLRVAAGPERYPQLMGAIESLLEAAGVDAVSVPYVCRAWTATRCD